MTTAFDGVHTADEWAEWQHRNTVVEAGALQIEKELVPSYVTPVRLLAGEETLETPVALAVNGCEDLFIMTADGDLYQYDPVKETLRHPQCVTYTDIQTSEPLGSPVDFCITGDTVYIVDESLQGVVALSARSYQVRWLATVSLTAPVAIAGFAGTAYVLDTAVGAVYTATPTGLASSPVVDGLDEPEDIAIGRDGRLLVLDRSGAGDSEYVVREFRLEAAADTDASHEGTDAGVEAESERVVTGDVVTVPERYQPTCIESLDAGGFILGTERTTGSETTPIRYEPTAGRFSPLTSLKSAIEAIARAATTGYLYVITSPAESSSTPAVYRFETTRPYRVDAERGTYSGTAWRRFDAGVPETEWHRLTAEVTAAGPSTTVSVRYVATDDPDLGSLDKEFGVPASYTELLETAGITGAWRLVEVGADDIAAICSISDEEITGWIERALDVVAEDVDDDIETIDGIGPIYGKRLKDAGLWLVADLFRVDRETLGELTQAPPGRVDNWYADAETLISDGDSASLEADLGIPARAVSLLEKIGVTDVTTLLLEDPAVLTSQLQLSPTETAEWVERARGRIERAWDEVVVGETTAPSDALLTDAIGQYLWVAVDLLGREQASPTVRSLRVYAPRETYLRYLPSIYRDDAESAAFLERYLSLFESVVMDIGADIDRLPAYIDPDGIPAPSLPWLASWVGVELDSVWPEDVQRALLSAAPELFKQRGTPSGIRRALELALGDPPPISPTRQAALDRETAALTVQAETGELQTTTPEAEIDRLTQAVVVLEAAQLACVDDETLRDLYDSLLGCPQCFVVLLDPSTPEKYHEAARRLVSSSTPAHTVSRTVVLRHQFELTDTGHAGHTYLGVNSTLAEPSLVLDRASLGHDAALGAAEDWGRLELMSRLDQDTVLS